MAPKLTGGSGRFDLGQRSAINLTPLVGVMLLLLVVFMSAAPPPTSAIKIENPVGHWLAHVPISHHAVFINIEKDRKLYIGARPTTLETLIADVGVAVGGANPAEHPIRVRADRDIPYGEFMTIMNTLKEAGYEVGLILEDF